MNKVFKYFERFLIWGILIAISIILIFAFIDIVYVISKHLLSAPFLIIDARGLMNLFSLLLLLLIGLELFETVRAYLKEDIVHVEFIILVAIIAISRKVIIWDFNQYNTEELVSLAVMILALGVAYFLIKKADRRFKKNWLQKNENKDKENDN
jgi:uncharacterized membrane protein (DUF373 family)